MNYGYITVDGKGLRKGQKQDRLTNGQIQLILLNVIMQKHGQGTGNSFGSYWSEEVGKPVIDNDKEN